MNRIPLLLTALAGSALVLAGCGSSGSSGQSTPPTTNPPAASPSVPVSGPSTGGAGTPSSTAFQTAAGSVTIGSADFPENELLADIYGDEMAAEGVKVLQAARHR